MYKVCPYVKIRQNVILVFLLLFLNIFHTFFDSSIVDVENVFVYFIF